MATPSIDVVIPDRAAFKASEVCDLAQLQPYVLRSWENEFPDLGVSRTPGGPRVYRRADVERVLQIRHLVLSEGLTLAGVRRRLEGAGPTPPVEKASEEDRALLREVMSSELKSRLARVKDGLRGILQMLSHDPVGSTEFHLESVPAAASAAPRRSARRKTE
jgi:DNA-binding transcriptional MerR regulator